MCTCIKRSPNTVCFICLQGMPTSYTELVKRIIHLFLACAVLLAPTAASLCEERCESANPSLHRLRALWTRMYKHSSTSFDQFVQSLVFSFNTERSLHPLMRTIVTMLGDYRECVMACEHQFSKRSLLSPYRRTFQIKQLYKTICKFHLKLHGTTHDLPSKIKMHCHGNKATV
ncbi:uncharacterized protein LOC121385686 [Gigantopelta aegis]|uniref:uncharacterized protein LOC121385686 n=1 Tax=Gigantopelta aegis TaxID=1735272 RepID=UPI001B88BB64|nr:uncharacterized protein LOC121385686 [Gigantopelta aegis]